MGLDDIYSGVLTFPPRSTSGAGLMVIGGAARGGKSMDRTGGGSGGGAGSIPLLPEPAEVPLPPGGG